MTPESKRYIEYRQQKVAEGYKQVNMLIPIEIKKDLLQIKNALVNDYKDNLNNMKIYNRKTKQMEDRIPKKSTLTKIREDMEKENTTELEQAQIDLPKTEAIQANEAKEVIEPINPDPNHYSHFLNKDNEKLKADLIEKNKKEWQESIDRVQAELKSRKNKQ